MERDSGAFRIKEKARGEDSVKTAVYDEMLGKLLRQLETLVKTNIHMKKSIHDKQILIPELKKMTVHITQA